MSIANLTSAPVTIADNDHGLATRLARLRLATCYLVRHQCVLDLERPATFTELVQRRKLKVRDLRMVSLADKVEVKTFVAETIGDAWVIPTLWHGVDLPQHSLWTAPIVLKSRHGCNQNLFLRSGIDDWQAARSKAHKWLDAPYGKWLDEWLYAHIPRGLLIEPFVGDESVLPVDYKFYTFGGRVTHVQVHLDREHRHRWMLFDLNWDRVSVQTPDPDPPPPENLAKMITAAEMLGASFDFVRSDFYEVGGRPLFGEMTFYPGSGLDKFHPKTLDSELGALWLANGGR
ncbi:MAG: ATP-grasp fold amidoligase family protein [Sphingorhabdus sp.]